MTHSIDDGRYYKDGLSHKHMNNCIDIEDDEDEEYSGNVNEKEMEQLSEVVKNLVVKNVSIILKRIEIKFKECI